MVIRSDKYFSLSETNVKKRETNLYPFCALKTAFTRPKTILETSFAKKISIKKNFVKIIFFT